MADTLAPLGVRPTDIPARVSQRPDGTIRGGGIQMASHSDSAVDEVLLQLSALRLRPPNAPAAVHRRRY